MPKDVAAAKRERNSLAFPSDRPRTQYQLELVSNTFVANVIVMKRLTDLTWPDADLTAMVTAAETLATLIRAGDLSTFTDTMISQANLMGQAWHELMSQWSDIMANKPVPPSALDRAATLMGMANSLQDRYVRTVIALKSMSNYTRTCAGGRGVRVS